MSKLILRRKLTPPREPELEIIYKLLKSRGAGPSQFNVNPTQLRFTVRFGEMRLGQRFTISGRRECFFVKVSDTEATQFERDPTGQLRCLGHVPFHGWAAAPLMTSEEYLQFVRGGN